MSNTKSKIVINGVTCGKHGVRINGKYSPCWYSHSKLITLGDAITLYARNLLKPLPKELGNVENDSDGMTDYFESDKIRFLAGTPEFESLLPLCS